MQVKNLIFKMFANCSHVEYQEVRASLQLTMCINILF